MVRAIGVFFCSSILGHIVLDEAAEEIKMNKKKTETNG